MVLDTDVYSQLYVRHGATVAAKHALKDVLVGRSVAIAVQTRAELLIWPGVHGWSADRAGRLRDQLDNTPTVPVDERVIEAFVRITMELQAQRPCAGAEAARCRPVGRRHRDRHQPHPAHR